MSYTEIKDFEVLLTPYSERIDVISLQFIINGRNFLTFPFYVKNIDTEIIDKFRKAIDGKSTTIDLRLDNEYYALLQINKDNFLFNILNSIHQGWNQLSLTQEFYQVFDNNTIFRNALRNFISDYKPPTDKQLDIINNYYFYNGAYLPNNYDTNIIISVSHDKNLFSKFNDDLGIYIFDNDCIETYYNSNFWKYNGVYIPKYIGSVPHKDKTNIYYQDGTQTNMEILCGPDSNVELSEELYRELYATCDNYGKYIYDLEKCRIAYKRYNDILEKQK
jgi:hypothetical protein